MHYLYAFILIEILWSLSSIGLISKILDQAPVVIGLTQNQYEGGIEKNLSDAQYFSESHLNKVLSYVEYEICG